MKKISVLIIAMLFISLAVVLAVSVSEQKPAGELKNGMTTVVNDNSEENPVGKNDLYEDIDSDYLINKYGR